MDTIHFWVVVGGGAFGGLLHALYLNKNSLVLPDLVRESRWHLSIGFLADMLLGIGASLAILYFIAPDTLLKQIPLSIISGFGGGSFLGSLSNKMDIELGNKKVNELKEVLEKYESSFEEIDQELKKKGG